MRGRREGNWIRHVAVKRLANRRKHVFTVKRLCENRNRAATMSPGLGGKFIVTRNENVLYVGRITPDAPAHLPPVLAAAQPPGCDDDMGREGSAEPNAFGGRVGYRHLMPLDRQRACQHIGKKRIAFDN
jgi:hypothetical protein